MYMQTKSKAFSMADITESHVGYTVLLYQIKLGPSEQCSLQNKLDLVALRYRRIGVLDLKGRKAHRSLWHATYILKLIKMVPHEISNPITHMAVVNKAMKTSSLTDNLKCAEVIPVYPLDKANYRPISVLRLAFPMRLKGWCWINYMYSLIFIQNLWLSSLPLVNTQIKSLSKERRIV